MIAVMQDISLLNDNEMQKERKYEMWVVFALGSAFFAGLTSILAKSVLKKPIQRWQQRYVRLSCLFFPG